MKFSQPAVFVFASLILISACDRPERDGERAERTERERRSEQRAEEREERREERTSSESVAQKRDVEDFHSIELRGAAELNITVGPAASLNLDASERTLKYVETRVKGDTLVIDVTKSRGWFSENGRLKITVTVPTLESLESNGAGDIEITGLNGGEQKLELAGAHNVKAEGRLDKLTLKLSGAGNANYRNVIVGDARVTVNGAGNVEVHATESLRAEVNGVGAVTYSGNPQKVESELHGLGSISRRNNAEHEDEPQEEKTQDDKPAAAAAVSDVAEQQKREQP